MKAINEDILTVPKEKEKEKSFMGHPKGLAITSYMALASAFGNYGMSSILIYYLYKTVSQGGLGLTQGNAAQLVGIYSSLSFMAGIVGGYVADRLLGIRKSLFIGTFVRTIGFLLLAVPNGGLPFYALSQLMLLLAASCMGTSLYALAGELYDKKDTRRDAGFSIMYIMNNVGAIAPMISGFLALHFNYHMGFLFAAIIQASGFILYMFTADKIFGPIGTKPSDPMPKQQQHMTIIKLVSGGLILVALIGILFLKKIITPTSFSNSVSMISVFIPLLYLVVIIKSSKTTQEEAEKVKAFIWIFVSNCFNMMIWFQSTSILAIYAEERVNLTIFGHQFSAASFQTVPAILAVTFGTIASSVWSKMGNKQPSVPFKFGMGTTFYGISALFMVIPFLLYPATAKASPLWLVGFYIIIIAGEALTAPVGMASATMVAPKAFTAQMVTVWQLSQSTGAGLSSLAVNFYKEGSEAQYFTGIGAITAIVGLVLWFAHKKVNQQMSQPIFNHSSIIENNQ